MTVTLKFKPEVEPGLVTEAQASREHAVSRVLCRHRAPDSEPATIQLEAPPTRRGATAVESGSSLLRFSRYMSKWIASECPVSGARRSVIRDRSLPCAYSVKNSRETFDILHEVVCDRITASFTRAIPS
jgi:hypothetical protein